MEIQDTVWSGEQGDLHLTSIALGIEGFETDPSSPGQGLYPADEGARGVHGLAIECGHHSACLHVCVGYRAARVGPRVRA